MAAAQRASRLEPGSKDAGMAVRRARAVAAARSRGNELFKAGKYGEASAAYGEGLEQEQHNAVLLCNRAACKSKLGQWEKAVEDCTAALAVRPSYTKARRRRADCNAKVVHRHDLPPLILSYTFALVHPPPIAITNMRYC